MKKIVYLLALSFGIALTSCDPMEDIYEEQGAPEVSVLGEVEFTMTDEDYEDLDLGYGNFSSLDDAKALIPELLYDKYPIWGDGSSALVTFDLYAPVQDEDSLIIYEVTTEDYDSNPDTAAYDNFDDMDQVYAFLADKYPSLEDNTLVSLTYKFYSGSVATLNDGFFYTNGGWEFVQGFTEDEYNAMGEGYANFSNEDEAAAKIPIFLKDKFKYDGKEAGDLEPIMYKLYVGGGVTESYIMYFIYDGSEWEMYDNVMEQTMQFGHDGTTWVPDNTIRYTLGGDDYTVIASSLQEKYPSAAGNALNYGNFERRIGNANYWSDEMLAEGFGILLDNKDPNAEEGQKYVLTFAIYNGSSGFESLSVIKTDGVWVLN